MNIETRFFGQIEIDNDKIIHFKDGIPGFENLTKFLFMTDKDDNSPFCWLQSIEDVDIVFTIFDILTVFKDYEPMVEEEYLESLGQFAKDDLAIYCIANISQNIEDMTINLKAPVVINLENRQAKQVICNNEEYPIKYYIYKELKKGGE